MNDELIFKILEEEKEVKRKILSFVNSYDKLPTSDDIPHSEYLFGQIPKLTVDLFSKGYSKPKRLVNVKTQRRTERGTNDVNQFAHNAGQYFPYSNEVSRSLIRRGRVGNHDLSAYVFQFGNIGSIFFLIDT